MRETVDIVLLAGRGVTALRALNVLHDRGLRVVVVLLDAHARNNFAGIAVVTPDAFVAVASERCERVMMIDDPDRVISIVDEYPQARILSVCFSRRVPVEARPNRLWLNVHPSALPAYRGPDPVFWQLRAGVRQLVVSVHVMAPRMDAGVVLAQRQIALDNLESERDIDEAIGECAGWLAPDVSDGSLQNASPGLARGRWYRSPVTQDYRVFPTWSVDRTTRFCRLLGSRGVAFSFPCAADLGRTIQGVLAAKNESGGGVLTRVELGDGAVWIDAQSV